MFINLQDFPYSNEIYKYPIQIEIPFLYSQSDN